MNGGIMEDFRRAWQKPNNALIQIILINVVFFAVIRISELFFIFGNAQDTFEYIFQQLHLPSNFSLFLSRPWSIVTYFFVHYDFFHIIFNMLFLYWFGKIIEDFVNSKRVITLYVLGGLCGGLLYMIIYNTVALYQNLIDVSMMIGASAGVYAIVVAAAVLSPNYTFFFILIGPVRIKYIALFYVFVSFLDIVGDNAGGAIAHLGGAFIGWFFISQLKKGNDIGLWIHFIIEWVASLFIPRPKIRVSYRSHGTHKSEPTQAKGKSNHKKPFSTKVSQEEIDAILDKISQSGYGSLTKEEKQKLFSASKK